MVEPTQFEKYARQNGNLPQVVGVNIKNVWNHHLDMLKTFHRPIKTLGVLLVPRCWNLFDIDVTNDQKKYYMQFLSILIFFCKDMKLGRYFFGWKNRFPEAIVVFSPRSSFRNFNSSSSGYNPHLEKHITSPWNWQFAPARRPGPKRKGNDRLPTIHFLRCELLVSGRVWDQGTLHLLPKFQLLLL